MIVQGLESENTMETQSEEDSQTGEQDAER